MILEWLILVLLIPLVIVPIVFIAGFTGCGFAPQVSPPPPPLPDPSDFVATPAGSGQILLTWNDNATNTTHFRIRRREEGGPTITLEGILAKTGMPPVANNYTDTLGLKPSTTYEYEIHAVAVNIESTGLVLAHATTLP